MNFDTFASRHPRAATAMVRNMLLPPYGRHNDMPWINAFRLQGGTTQLAILHHPTNWGLMRVQLPNGDRRYLHLLRSRVVGMTVRKWLDRNPGKSLVGCTFIVEPGPRPGLPSFYIQEPRQ